MNLNRTIVYLSAALAIASPAFGAEVEQCGTTPILQNIIKESIDTSFQGKVYFQLKPCLTDGVLAHPAIMMNCDQRVFILAMSSYDDNPPLSPIERGSVGEAICNQILGRAM